MRRIVTGRDDDGRSVFVSDVELAPEPSPSGGRVVHVWGDDDVPALPTDGTPPTYDSLFPPPAGFRVLYSTLLPGSRRVEHLPSDQPGGDAPHAHAHFEAGSSGMHTSDTVDICLVIDGEVYVELDDGAERLLTAGDVLVQNGTRHAWHNRSGRECSIVITMVGATSG